MNFCRYFSFGCFLLPIPVWWAQESSTWPDLHAGFLLSYKNPAIYQIATCCSLIHKTDSTGNTACGKLMDMSRFCWKWSRWQSDGLQGVFRNTPSIRSCDLTITDDTNLFLYGCHRMILWFSDDGSGSTIDLRHIHMVSSPLDISMFSPNRFWEWCATYPSYTG